MENFKIYLPKNKLNNLNNFPKVLYPKNSRIFFYEGQPNCQINYRIKLITLNRKIMYEGVIRKIFSPEEFIPIIYISEKDLEEINDFFWGIAFEIDNEH